jgi:hypothetical protein
LDDVKCVLPELGAASEQNHTNTVGLGELRPPDLTLEDDELLPEQDVLCDRTDSAAGRV